MAQQETADETRAAVEQLTRQVRDLESQLAALAKRVLRIEADYYEDKEDPGELS
jgi:outer membrane murein-binding lipoprotein Lpp